LKKAPHIVFFLENQTLKKERIKGNKRKQDLISLVDFFEYLAVIRDNPGIFGLLKFFIFNWILPFVWIIKYDPHKNLRSIVCIIKKWADQFEVNSLNLA
jgi:hypothetical protein